MPTRLGSSRGSHPLQEYNKHQTLPFYISYSLKQRLNSIEKLYPRISQSHYVEQCMRNLITFIHHFEEQFLLVKSSKMTNTSMSRCRITKEEHKRIYTYVQDYKLFPSRSEMMRFSLFLQMILEIITMDQEFAMELKKKASEVFKTLEQNEENEDLNNDFFDNFDFELSLEKLRKVYPQIPDFKYMNEE